MSTEKATEKASSNQPEKTNTREKILETAIELFAKKGFNGTTTKEIAEAAEVNESLIFRHFSTKKELYGAIIEQKIDEEPGIELPLYKYKDTKDDYLIFKSIAERMLDKCGKDSSFIRLLHFSALEGHELSDMFFSTYVEYIDMLLCDYIEIRIADGAFKKIHPLSASQAFIGMVVNHIIVQELFGGKKRNKVNNEELVETFVTVFLDGIKTT
ncbi:MAG: TetR/AcrR family transcriptional regulator [Candidatus Dadabacteria bacterium]|jgi:AcrR family transcriptional regulator